MLFGEGVYAFQFYQKAIIYDQICYVFGNGVAFIADFIRDLGADWYASSKRALRDSRSFAFIRG